MGGVCQRKKPAIAVIESDSDSEDDSLEDSESNSDKKKNSKSKDSKTKEVKPSSKDSKSKAASERKDKKDNKEVSKDKKSPKPSSKKADSKVMDKLKSPISSRKIENPIKIQVKPKETLAPSPPSGAQVAPVIPVSAQPQQPPPNLCQKDEPIADEAKPQSLPSSSSVQDGFTHNDSYLREPYFQPELSNLEAKPKERLAPAMETPQSKPNRTEQGSPNLPSDSYMREPYFRQRSQIMINPEQRQKLELPNQKHNEVPNSAGQPPPSPPPPPPPSSTTSPQVVSQAAQAGTNELEAVQQSASNQFANAPRYLQLENGIKFTLPNSNDFQHQLNNAQLQAAVKAYFDEMIQQAVAKQVANTTSVQPDTTTSQPAMHSSMGQQQVQGLHNNGQTVQLTPSLAMFGSQSQQVNMSQPSQQATGELQYQQQQIIQSPASQTTMDQLCQNQPQLKVNPQPYISEYGTIPPQQQQPMSTAGQSMPFQQQVATTFEAQQRQQQPPIVPQTGPPHTMQPAQSGFPSPQQHQMAPNQAHYQQQQQQQSAQVQPPSQGNTSLSHNMPSRSQMSRSVQAFPSANQFMPSNSNPSVPFLRPQATTSLLFPSIAPGSSPFRPPANANAAHQRMHMMQPYQPSLGTQKQAQPLPPGMPLQPPKQAQAMSFPVFPPSTPRPRGTGAPGQRAPPPPPNPMFIPAMPPSTVPTSGYQPKQQPYYTRPPLGMPMDVGPPMAYSTGTGKTSPGRGQKHHHDAHTHEQLELILREIQEIKGLVHGPDMAEIVRMMEQWVNAIKKYKTAYVCTIRDLKKDERFRAEKNRADSKIRQVYQKVKGDYKEITSSIDAFHKDTQQMLTSLKKAKSPKSAVTAKPPAAVAKQTDLMQLNQKMDQLLGELSNLKNVAETLKSGTKKQCTSPHKPKEDPNKKDKDPGDGNGGACGSMAPNISSAK